MRSLRIGSLAWAVRRVPRPPRRSRRGSIAEALRPAASQPPKATNKFFPTQAKSIDTKLVGARIGLIRPHRIVYERRIEHALQSRCLDATLERCWREVQSEHQWRPLFLQFRQTEPTLRPRFRCEVRVEELLAFLVGQLSFIIFAVKRRNSSVTCIKSA